MIIAGVPFEKGDEAGNLQHASLCYAIANVHTEKLNGKIISSEFIHILDTAKAGAICACFSMYAAPHYLQNISVFPLFKGGKTVAFLL